MTAPQFDFKKLRAGISLHYGIDLDETSLTILAILTQEMNRQFIKMDKAQDEMATQIQYSKKALQVDPNHPRWQAFWHGMGQWGFALCLAIVAVLAIFFTNVNNDKKQQEMQQALVWYKEHYEATQKASAKSVNTGTNKKNSRSKNKQAK